jgi:hypothetical protein
MAMAMSPRSKSDSYSGSSEKIVGQVPGSTQIAEYLANPFGERAELQLLALDDHQTTTLACLEQEEAIANFAAHTDHYLVGCIEHILHEATNSFSDPVELTHSTIGVPAPMPSALTEHVEITVR